MMNGHSFPPADGEPTSRPKVEILPRGTILIVGGGPVGLTLATVLASYGVKSVVLERNQTTTKWPKMDLTNIRSMELFRKVGLADELRKQGVPSHLPYSVLISTGLGVSKPVAEWQHPGVDVFRTQIASKNDGTMPLEPWQRLSQAVFEKWLKGLCDINPYIDLRFGCKAEGVEELEEGARLVTTDSTTGIQSVIISRYLVGCDGGSSRVRRSLGIPLEGGPMPVYVLLVHFKSRDLTRLHAQGRFWHLFILGETGLASTCIAQNDKDVWTCHLLLPMDQDSDHIGSEEAVYRALGGIHGPYEIKIDEILVRSTYRPNIAIARTYSGSRGHVYLAGDAAHQNVPTGGYGMNMGIADAFELGWKLAAVANGHGQPAILQTYEQERRPVAVTSIERSGAHMKVHMDAMKPIDGRVQGLDADTEEGQRLRQLVQEHYKENDGENTDWGIEMGYRYKSDIIISDGGKEPVWKPSEYMPTTFAGSRAPHLFLRDGSPIFDQFGPNYTLVEFLDGHEHGVSLLLDAAWRNLIPVKHLPLANEEHAHSVYEKRLVLIRPDGHVAWRADEINDAVLATDIFATLSGRKNIPAAAETSEEVIPAMDDSKVGNGGHSFTSTVGVDAQTSKFELEKMGEFQT